MSRQEAEQYYNIGINHYENERFEQAEQYFATAVSIDPNYAEAYYNLGITYLYSQNLDKAIEIFNTAVQLNPNDAAIYHNLGITYCEKGEYDYAIKNLITAIKINPDDAETYQNLGVACYKKGNYEEAISNFQQSLDHNNKNAEVYHGIGMVYSDQGDFKLATEFLSKAMEINPDSTASHEILHLVKKAKQILEKELTKPLASNIDPQEEKPFMDLQEARQLYHTGVAQAEQGDYQLAICSMKRALEINPDYAEVKETLDFVNRLVNEEEKRKQAEIEGLSKKIEAEQFYNLGLALAKNNHYDIAAEHFKRALSIYPSYKEAKEALLSITKTSVLQPQAAIEPPKKKCRIHLKEAEHFYNIATAQIRNSNYDLAIDNLKQALSIYPDYRVAQDTLYSTMKLKNNLIQNKEVPMAM